MKYTLHRAQARRPLGCRTLREAMVQAGHPDPSDWLPDAGAPDRIITESMAGELAIEAVGVAHELIGLLPVGACATWVWSDADPAITCAVMKALPSPFLVSTAVAARLSAHYAIAGILSKTTIEDTVAGAFGDLAAGYASDFELIITAISEALDAAEIPTLLPLASAAQGLQTAPSRPGVAWLSSSGAAAGRRIELRLFDVKTDGGPPSPWT